MNQIVEIARAMRAALAQSSRTPAYAERVHRGTYLALYQRDSRLQLYVGRTDTEPQASDAARIAEAFDVAAATEPERVRIRIASQDGHFVPVHCFKFAWTELDA